VLIDNHPDAIRIMAERLVFANPEVVGMEVEIPNNSVFPQLKLMEDI
jgi:hypothetical protein